MTTTLVDASDRTLAPGIVVGPLAFGTWRFTRTDVTEAGRILDAALDAGLRLVDTADVYGLDWGGSGFGAVESLLGEVLRADPSRRQRMVLATKGGIVPGLPYDSSAANLRLACDASLRRLGVQQVDLYQIHRPDLFTHPHEVATALATILRQGKARAVGISNYAPAQHDALAHELRTYGIRLATTQPEYSVAHLAPLRDGTLDRAMRDRVTPLAWSPLAGGRLLSGDGVRAELIAVLDELAEREGVTRAAVAIAFVLAHPSRPVAIIGSQRPEHLAAAIAATRVHLDRRDLYRLIEASEGVPLP